MLGCEEGEVGHTPEEWFRRIHPADLEQVRLGIDDHLAGGTAQFENQHRMLHKDGTYRWMSCRATVTRDESGQAVRMAGTLSDITAEKVVDTLTGLPNRLLFFDRLTRSIERAKRRNDFLFAVLLLDLDRFRSHAERLGSGGGDRLLIAAARRLETCLRTGDTVARLGRDHVVARLDGDEFTILLDGLNEVGEAELVAGRLLKAISAPIELDSHQVFLSASIGIALSATGYSNPEEVLRDADTALHRAKSLGKARCEVFDTEALCSARTRLQLETDLRTALERQEFSVFFEPIVSLASGRLAGFEALVRWMHPVRGMVSPLEFIPIAERSGMIIPLGQVVLHDACRQLKTWQEHLGIPREFWISVNLSSLQFKLPSLAEEIGEVLSDVGLEPGCLVLELTESVMMESPQAVNSLLMQMRVMGIKIALDDFGTGYSSLSYLRQFPIDFLKIDHSFIRGIETSKDLEKIVRSIGDLAHHLGVRVIVEGIENAEQLDVIRTLQCEYGQGYLFSKPVNGEQAEDLLRADILQSYERDSEKESGANSPALIDQPSAQLSPHVVADLHPEGPLTEPKKREPARRTGQALAIVLATLMVLLACGLAVKISRNTSRTSLGTANPEIAADSRAASGENATAESGPSPIRASGQMAIRESAPPRSPGKAAAPATKKSPGCTLPVVHQHVLGSCRGNLRVSPEALSFISEREKDSFTLKYAEFSRELSNDQLTIRSGSKAYRFKAATARSKEENRSQLKRVADAISNFQPEAGSRRQ